jgi:hypothetical protein
MADTNHSHETPRVQPDNISFRGIIWFAVILTATTLFCQGLVSVLFHVMEARAVSADAARPPLAAPAASPVIKDGHVVSGLENAPAPGLLVSEPTVLGDFRRQEEHTLSSYAIDKNTGTIQIPIERAKALVLERGLPTRPAAGAAPVVPAQVAPAKARTAGGGR